MPVQIYTFKNEIGIEGAYGATCKLRKDGKWIPHLLWVCIFLIFIVELLKL